ncbi:hypothetical protein [Pararobbsia silviterrae]|uniref:DUF3300 domain-containing protein n=1 Tax=Pararobbsia silviterrae TaxID=1792498 RepID=A0A494XXE1_9BURK|nr:hypothetical protein [Pararobbsia silviterrae]RKP53688.1 hypothetical protein D7S86_15600 [Pararobbsia silviterrae]
MKSATLMRISALAIAATLYGCATNDQGVVVVDPNKVNEIITNALTPPPPVAVVAPAPVIVEDPYAPVPTDAYVLVAVDSDVVVIGGNTYIWVVGPNGKRERHFYAHGDHRQDVFRRRDELHNVMAQHGGHLPDHAIAGTHPGAPGAAHAGPGGVAAHGAPGATVAHAAPAPGHPVAAAKPAPAKPASKDPKKS